MVQVKELSDKKLRKIYKKLSKKVLIAMLIQNQHYLKMFTKEGVVAYPVEYAKPVETSTGVTDPNDDESGEKWGREDRKRKWEYDEITLPTYLVRPGDFQIFDLDRETHLYRSWTRDRSWTRVPLTDRAGNRMTPNNHYTYENLTNNYNFFPIAECELEEYEKKMNSWMNSTLTK